MWLWETFTYVYENGTLFIKFYQNISIIYSLHKCLPFLMFITSRYITDYVTRRDKYKYERDKKHKMRRTFSEITSKSPLIFKQFLLPYYHNNYYYYNYINPKSCSLHWVNDEIALKARLLDCSILNSWKC